MCNGQKIWHSEEGKKKSQSGKQSVAIISRYRMSRLSLWTRSGIHENEILEVTILYSHEIENDPLNNESVLTTCIKVFVMTPLTLFKISFSQTHFKTSLHDYVKTGDTTQTSGWRYRDGSKEIQEQQEMIENAWETGSATSGSNELRCRLKSLQTREISSTWSVYVLTRRSWWSWGVSWRFCDLHRTCRRRLDEYTVVQQK